MQSGPILLPCATSDERLTPVTLPVFWANSAFRAVRVLLPSIGDCSTLSSFLATHDNLLHLGLKQNVSAFQIGLRDLLLLQLLVSRNSATWRLFRCVSLVTAQVAAGLDCDSGVLRDFLTEYPAERLRIIGVNLCIVARSRDCHVGQPCVDELFVGPLGIHVQQHAVGSDSLAAMAGDRISVVQMRVLSNVELHLSA